MMSFTVSFVFINNSSTSRQRGSFDAHGAFAATRALTRVAPATANGIAQSFVSIGRIVGPIVGGMVSAPLRATARDAPDAEPTNETQGFAATASGSLPWPLDYKCFFHIAGFLYVAVVVLSYALDDAIESKID